MKTLTLQDVCEVIMGQAPAGDTYNTTGDGVGLIAGAGDFSNGLLKPKKFTNRPTKLSTHADIVLSIRASIGEKVWADGEYCLGRGVAALRTGPSVDAKFLWHWITITTPILKSKAKGATFLQVSRMDIGKLPIALPPLDEQRRIAAILDKTDELRTKRRESLAQLNTLVLSIFHDMFGDPETNTHGWPTVVLADVADQITDGEHLTPRRESDGIKLLSARNVRNGYLQLEDVDYIGESEYERISRRCKPQRDDVLISCSGSIGRVAVVETDERFSLVRSAAMVRPTKTKVFPKFLERLLLTPSLQRQMLKGANASSQANLFQGPIRRLKVIVPPLTNQQEFSKRVDAVDQIKEHQRAQLAELDALFASLQHRAFKGEL